MLRHGITRDTEINENVGGVNRCSIGGNELGNMPSEVRENLRVTRIRMVAKEATWNGTNGCSWVKAACFIRAIDAVSELTNDLYNQPVLAAGINVQHREAGLADSQDVPPFPTRRVALFTVTCDLHVIGSTSAERSR